MPFVLFISFISANIFLFIALRSASKNQPHLLK